MCDQKNGSNHVQPRRFQNIKGKNGKLNFNVQIMPVQMGSDLNCHLLFDGAAKPRACRSTSKSAPGSVSHIFLWQPTEKYGGFGFEGEKKMEGTTPIIQWYDDCVLFTCN